MSLIKNFSFVFGAQTLILVISIVRALILPKFLSIEGFGYWEVYWFYTAYVGIFCLGYADGVYLKYGGYNYDKLPIQTLRSGNRTFVGMLLLFVATFLFIVTVFVEDENTRFAQIFAALNILVLGISSLYIYIFQITNLFKRYSFFSIFDKLLVFITIICLLIVNQWNYRYIVVIDFSAKTMVMLLMIRKSPELLFGEVCDFKTSLKYMKQNMSVGIKLMVANLMGMLLIGAGKFIVQYYGDIKDFAIYSFGISLTGLVLVAVSSFGLVLYPTIKRIERERYSEIFHRINSFNRFFCLTALGSYFPVYYFVLYIYPKYSSVLIYLNVLYVLIFMQSKIGMLNNTFYKALREENNLLKANLTCVFLFAVLAFVFFSFYPQMWVIAVCTCIAMVYRCYSSEIFLCNKLSVNFNRGDYSEILFLIVFLLSTTFLSPLVAFVIFISTYMLWFSLYYTTNKEILMKLIGGICSHKR